MHKKSINHLLLIRISSLGDVVMTVPVVAALRRAYPSLRISILTRPGYRRFFREITDIEFVCYDPEMRHKGLGGCFRLAGDIRSVGADAVADLQDNLMTGTLCAILRAKGLRISTIDSGRAEQKAMTRRARKVLTPLAPMTERYRDAIVRLGLEFSMPCEEDVKVRAVPETITAAAGIKNGIWIGIAPFAKHKAKIYPIPSADTLIGILAASYGKVFILGGGTHEKSFAEGMEKRHKNVVSVIGRLTVDEELDLIGNLDVVVTMDSASMHIASSVHVPVVSVWGATHPFSGFYGYGQNPADAIQADLPCRPCSVHGNKPCIFGNYRCLSSIEPQTIADAVARVLERTGKISRTGEY